MAGNPRVACASIAWFLYDSALLFTDCNLAVVRAGLNAKLQVNIIIGLCVSKITGL